MEFTQFAAVHGLIIKSLEVGRWVRVPTIDHPSSRNGAYFYDFDYGHVQNWAEMTSCESWRDDKPMTPRDAELLRSRMEASRKQHAQERAKEAAEAAKRAQTIISSSIIESHEYLGSKGIKDSGMVWYQNQDTNLLVVPMRIDDGIAGVQLIDRDGNKKFLKGQRTNGAEYIFGTRGIDWLVEGYATGRSLKESLDAFKINARIHVCFSAGNLARIGKSMKKAFICCDNDVSETGEKAAIETGHPYYMPYTKGDDLNDQWKRDGTFKTGMALQKWINEVKNK